MCREIYFHLVIKHFFPLVTAIALTPEFNPGIYAAIQFHFGFKNKITIFFFVIEKEFGELPVVVPKISSFLIS